MDLKLNIRKVMENHAHIIDKERKDHVIKFNQAQDQLYNLIKERKKAGKKCRFLVLKSRQLGISTFSEGFGTTLNLLHDNQSMLVVAHTEPTSQQLYSMSHYFYDNFPDWLKTNAKIVKDNQNEMGLSNGSKLNVMVASKNNAGVGRGFTFTYVHLSEYDWWQCDAEAVLAGILSACTPDAIVIIETTANGCGAFKKLWDQAVTDLQNGNDSNDWYPVFFPWFTDKKCVEPYNGFELTKEEERLKIKFNLTNEQISWRRKTIKSYFSGNIKMFNQEFPATPEEAFISSGQCIFDLQKINNRKEELRETKEKFADKGYFLYKISYDSLANERRIEQIKWVSDSRNGFITIYKKVNNRMPYILAIDPAGNGSDFTAINVLNNRTCEQVSTLHKNGMTSFEISCQAYCLGQYYNDALIGSETNFAPEVTSNLKELGYLNLYVMGNSENDMNKKLGTKYGFRTTTITRPYLISMLIDYINNNSMLINDYNTLVEAENFVKVIKVIDGKTKQKEQANIGQHDDLLMSLGIALYMRDSNQQTFELLPEKVEEKKEFSEYDWIFGVKKEKNNGGEFLTYD